MNEENVVLKCKGILSAIKRNEILSFTDKWMEVRTPSYMKLVRFRKTNIMFSLKCGR
jgi:hypothetical protein